MADIRKNENLRESWNITNNSTNNINIGDLPLIPTIKPTKTVDLLKFYTREKISHSTDMVNLVKRGVLSLNKKKIFSNGLPGLITIEKIDEAITPAEENELIEEITIGEEITDDSGGVLIHGKDIEENAQPVGVTGVDNNEIKVNNIEIDDLLDEIFKELKKINLHMSIMTDAYLRDQDITD